MSSVLPDCGQQCSQLGQVVFPNTFAKHMNNPTVFTLTNGIRVVHQHVTHTKIVHCGIFLDIGSRDEHEGNQGITHFWEHMAFKGTKHRKAHHIINYLESVGGDLNAYTDKEKVVFYASIRDAYFEKAVDILSDITFNSSFPEHQILRERNVIMEEMAMYKDDPDDSLTDEFDAVVFKKHPMGMNILGKPETVQHFRKKDFIHFLNENLRTNRIVFSVVGNIPLTEVEKLVKKYLEVPMHLANPKRKKVTGTRASERIIRRQINQSRAMLGGLSFSIHDRNRIPFSLLVNILGGPAMNSRLNSVLREKHGLVYAVEAHNYTFTDTGLFSIYFGTEPNKLDKCLNLVKREMMRLCETPLTPRQLSQAKEQMKGQLAFSEENKLNVMLMMGRAILDLGNVPTIEEVFQSIDETDAPKIIDLSNKMFIDKKLNYLLMLPEN